MFLGTRSRLRTPEKIGVVERRMKMDMKMDMTMVMKSMFVVSDALKDLPFEMAMSIVCTAIDELIARHGKDPNEVYEFVSKAGMEINGTFGVMSVE